MSMNGVKTLLQTKKNFLLMPQIALTVKPQMFWVPDGGPAKEAAAPITKECNYNFFTHLNEGIKQD